MDVRCFGGSRMPRLGCAAVLVLSAPVAHAANYCVGSASEFANALAAAGGNGQDNTIRLRAGSYVTSGAAFTYGNLGTTAVTIEGGYDDACATQDPTPGLSVLDGADLTQVLSIQSRGDITIRHLTLQNAFYGGSAGGGAAIAMNGQTADATTLFDSNVVRSNVDTYASGGLTVYGLGTIYIRNNLFTGNSAPSAAAFSTSMSAGSSIYVTNNTVTANVSSNPTSYTMVIGGGEPTTLGYVSNTVSYANTATYDFYLSGFETVLFSNNDYGSISGSAPKPGSSGNLIGVDPQFVAAEDFHVLSTSPLLRAGTITPAGGLAASDLEGNPRSVAGKVDIGAYENVDVIFADDFELP